MCYNVSAGEPARQSEAKGTHWVSLTRSLQRKEVSLGEVAYRECIADFGDSCEYALGHRGRMEVGLGSD